MVDRTIDQVIGFESLEQLSEANVDSALVITDGAVPRTYASNLDHWVIARPRTLVVGVGCSTGASPADVEALALSALDEAELSPLSVSALASIDRRADEPVICQLAERLGCALHTFTATQLAEMHVPSPSDAVKIAVGTPSVCEAAALLASGSDQLLLTKRKNAVATAAIARLADRGI